MTGTAVAHLVQHSEERHAMDPDARKHRAELLAESLTQFTERYRGTQKRVADTLHLTVAEARLLHMFENDVMLASSGFARRLGLSISRMTRIVDGMVVKSLVRRAPAPHDRRVVTLMLTPKGRELRTRLVDTLVHTHEAILQALPDEHRLSAVTLLQQLTTAVLDSGRD